ncbi:Serine/threonine-protein phosphatase 1 regulatory subunit 10 [Lemmus lemmus]
MGSGPIDPKELLKGLDSFLTRDGEVKSVDGISKIFSLMKEARKMVSRCTYLNIILQTRAPEVLVKFIDVGGYKLLNNWLTYSKTTNNIPLLQQILLTLQHLPLTVDHLKQVPPCCIAHASFLELRKLASVLVSDWMAVIRSQSSTQPAEKDKKKRKEEGKSRTTLPERPLTEVKAETRAEEAPEKKKEKPKSLRTTAPSHAKFRSTGLELDTPSLVPVKKNSSTVVVSDKYNLKPIPLKRQSATTAPGDAAPPAEKKYKPLNTTPNTTKEIKVKIIPPQPMEGLGFLDALNSAPVPGIKIKKKKKQPSPFEGKTNTEPSTAKPSSPEPAPPAEPMDTDRPGTPVPPVEVPELMDAASSEPGALDAKPVESPGDPSQLTRKGRKRKTVTWPEEGKLREYFYFELDETERVNVNKIKDFGEAAKREILSDRHAFETARRLSHDNMEEKVPWVCPRPLVLPSPLVIPGSNSQERYIQAEREKGILQELFLNKESPHEPDPEPYEPIPPKLIPLDEECSMDETPYVETLEPGVSGSPDGAGGSKLPPVLANLMGSMGAGKSPQGPGGGGINVQEILTSIMGSPNSHPSEELLKQPDYSDKLKQMLVPHGLLGPGPVANGFPPGGPGGPKGMQHFPPGPGGPMPGPHGGPGGPVGPRLLGPPPPRGGDPFWDGPGDPMRGGPMRGGPGPGPGPYHRGRGGRGGNEPPPPPPFRGARGGRSGGGPPNGRGGPGGGGMVGGGGHRPHDGPGGGMGSGHRSHDGPGGGMGSGHRSHDGPGGGMGSGHRSHDGPGHGGPHGHRPHDVPSHRGHDHRGPPPHEHRGHDGHGGGGHRGHDGGHSHGGDMSNRPVCRHFMMKGSCRYENNCAFYHPGVNGPPLP